METWILVKRGDKCLSCILREQKRKLTHCSLSGVSHPCTQKGIFANSQGVALDESELLLMLTKRLESLSCSCRKKGECHTLDSSAMLSITSAISWHQDADETASHLQPPPFLRFQDTLCYSSHMQYRVSKCQGTYNNVQWFTVCWGNLCDLLPSFIPGASLFGSISDSTAAGRENFLLQWGCSLTCLGLCHLSIVTGRLPMYWQLSSCNN